MRIRRLQEGYEQAAVRIVEEVKFRMEEIAGIHARLRGR
jgi:hypothetical protein